MNKRIELIVGTFLFAIFLSFVVSAQSFFPTYQANRFSNQDSQYYQPSFQTFYSERGMDYKTFWPILAETEKCEARQDFMVNIRPGGCMPAVVRSDLLEEQNVAVLCKLDAIKLNPLINVGAMKSVSFKGNYPKEVAGVSFHPSLAALRIYRPVLDSPLLNDVGYVVVVLKRQESERTMPKDVTVNLTATLKYDMENIFGAGRTSFYLPVMSNEDWDRSYENYGFFKGRGYLRADWVDKDNAEISIYSDKHTIIGKVVVKKGETSKLVYLPGFYCNAGIQLRLKEMTTAKTRATIKVDELDYQFVKGERFLDNNCYVENVEGYGGGAGRAVISCRGKKLNLKIGIPENVVLKNGSEEKEYELGEKISGAGADSIYLAHIGKTRDETTSGDSLFVILVKNSERKASSGKINDKDLSFISENFEKWKKEGEKTKNWRAYVAGRVSSSLSDGKAENAIVIFKGESSSSFEYEVMDKGGIKDKACGETDNDCKKIEDYFKKTNETARELVRLYGSEKPESRDYYGAVALWELSELAEKLGKIETQIEILMELKNKYPSSYFADEAKRKIEKINFFNYKEASQLVQIGNELHYISLEQVERAGYEELSAEFSLPYETADKKERHFLVGEYVLAEDETQPEKGEYVKILSIEQDKVIAEYRYKMLGRAEYKIERKELTTGDSLFISESGGIGISDRFTLGKNEILRNGGESGLELKNNGSEKYIQKAGKFVAQILSNGEIQILDENNRTEILTALKKYKFVNNNFVLKETPVVETTGKKRAILEKINYKQVAEVELISKIPDGYSEANFSVKIGIEKRAIKLNPDKAREKMENLNKSIEQFENIVKKLGDVVKVWKGTCLATSAGLIVKNFFANTGGRSLARQTAMRSSGGWFDKCNKMVSTGEGGYGSVNECLNKNSNDIEKDIDEIENNMKKVNDDVKKYIDANTKSTGMFSGKNFDANKTANQLAKEKFIGFKNSKGKDIKVMVNGKERMLSELSDDEVIRLVNEGELSTADMRDIMAYGSLTRESNKAMAKETLAGKLAPVFEVADTYELKMSHEEGVKKLLGQGTSIQSVAKKQREVYVDMGMLDAGSAKKLQTATSSSEGIIKQIAVKDEFVVVEVPTGTTIERIGGGVMTRDEKYDGSVLYVPVKQTSGDKYSYDPEKHGFVIDKNGNIESAVGKEDMNAIMSKLEVGSFVKISKALCQNKYLNAQVRFFETEPYKGMPALVPVDVNKGWYAATKQVLPGFGMKPAAQSGMITSLWLCNVGRNGKEEWDSSVNDDKPCIQINYETGQPLNQISCLEEGEAQRLALKAKRIMEQAYSQYGSGKKRIRLESGEFDVKPALKTTGTQCEDFMSASDCNLLFNVCDPVMCPTSRCNFGGTFQVDDVIQSGIVGSMLLCLPNFGMPSEGGVVVPVCLSGVHAGLDAYISILKSMRDCYAENIKSGKYVGICDEVYSIYLCEFFWRQAAPLADYAVPKVIEYAYTGGKMQGGGEYLTFQDAWDTSQKSAKYITDVYAVNAFKAFQARSTAEVGSEVCKSFIGTRYPTKLDTLLEPDSPTQFQAWFDEIAYTDATYPATSQYKVYYHIYSGKDSGHYYSVYLKNPPQTNYYSSQPYIVAETGYVGIGQSIDKTKDFTAPAGYKELCVRIDTTEKCGFKSVSTSMALQMIKDSYAKEQATEEITNEKDCVSGTPSLYSLAQPNIQEGAANIVQPALYKTGIIRICSTNNPGERTNPSRWTSVGYCDSNKNIKCWLDKDSVQNVIKDLGVENKTLKEAEKIANKEMVESKEIFGEAETTSKLANIESKFKSKDFELIKAVNIPGRIDKISEDNGFLGGLIREIEELKQRSYFNNQRAEAFFFEFKVYKALVEKLLKEYVPVAPVKVGIEMEKGGASETGGKTSVSEEGATAGIGGGLEEDKKTEVKEETKSEEKIQFLIDGRNLQENTEVTSDKSIEIKHSCDGIGYDLVKKDEWPGKQDSTIISTYYPTKNIINLKRFKNEKYFIIGRCFDFSKIEIQEKFSPVFNFKRENLKSTNILKSVKIGKESYDDSFKIISLRQKYIRGENILVKKEDVIEIVHDYDYVIYRINNLKTKKYEIIDYLPPLETNVIPLTRIDLKKGELYDQEILAYDSSGAKFLSLLTTIKLDE